MRPAVLVSLLAIGCGGDSTRPLLELRTETIRRLDAGPPADAMPPDAGPDRHSPPTNQAPEHGPRRLTNLPHPHGR
jgi:hypothetical protein